MKSGYRRQRGFWRCGVLRHVSELKHMDVLKALHSFEALGSVNPAIRRNVPEEQNPQRQVGVEYTPEVGENHDCE